MFQWIWRRLAQKVSESTSELNSLRVENDRLRFDLQQVLSQYRKLGAISPFTMLEVENYLGITPDDSIRRILKLPIEEIAVVPRTEYLSLLKSYDRLLARISRLEDRKDDGQAS